MNEEDKKDIPGEEKKEKPPEKKASPPKKPDFDEEALRREVPSIIADKIKKEFPDSLEAVSYYAEQVIVRIHSDSLLEVCSFLKEDPSIALNYLSCITGVDYPEREKRFDLVYHLYSIGHNHRVTLKISVGEKELVPSVTSLWKTANWHERETYDLLGIEFSGHPNLERILTPDRFSHHPLRKDFPVQGNPEEHVKYRE
jgi:NADH-quinone oxidoreductase subunit C